MKARGHRPSAFIVSRCLEPLMKHEAQVFDMISQSRQKYNAIKHAKLMYSLREWQIAHASLCLYFESRLSHVSSVLLQLMVMAEKKKKAIPSRFRFGNG